MCDSKYIIYKTHEPIKGKKWIEEIPVSCGKCIICKLRRVNDWVLRLGLEAERSRSALFVTLTYKNENLTKTQRNLSTLVKKDLQKFFKRLRKITGQKDIKYYAVGEYGSITKRPHYHAIIFNATEKHIDQAWTLNKKTIGIVHYGSVNRNSIAYTAKYMDKQSFIGYSKNDFREKQFSIMSKGLGSNFATQQMQKYLKNTLPLTVKRDGKKFAIPRYFIKKYLTDEEQEARKAKIEHIIADSERKEKKKFEAMAKKNKNYTNFENWKRERIAHRNYIFNRNLKNTRNVH